MWKRHAHLTDEELVLLGDSEMSKSQAENARAHLASCWTCRTRMTELDGTIADFVRLYHEDSPQNASSAAGARALLKARLAELPQALPERIWPFSQKATLAGCVAASVCAIAVLAALAVWRSHSPVMSSQQTVVAALPVVPNPDLTPGAARTINRSDVCTASHIESAREVPGSMQRKVFAEYGLGKVRTTDFEVDYLITPELGGAADIRNLWPEPHSSVIWNSYVKDALEDRLYRLVCDGAVDLPTAQRDIATDWIAAYKKYFHTDTPVSAHSKLAGYEAPVSGD